jgi:ATP-dependent Clp protease ATP-binding subunit ClpC
MFEHFDDGARQCVVVGDREARRLGHEELGTVHLLLGVGAVAPELIGVSVEALRASIVALHGSSPAGTGDGLPISAETKAALEGANAQALALGHTTIDVAHLLLAILQAGGGAARALREAGAAPSAVRDRANAVAGAGAQAPPAQAVTADDAAADAAMLGLVLRRDGAVARLLHEHGIDAALLRERFGLADPGG